MPSEEKSSESGEAAGFLKSLGDSIRSHVDERLRSPFAGAFVIAWIIVNWRSIAILLFSQASIEDRISAATNAKGLYETIVHPLWLAALLSIAFYAGSAAFLTLLECYGVVRRKIEMWFDEIRWVSPNAYMAMKKKYQGDLADLTSLATDNLSKVQQEQQRVAELSREKIDFQRQIQEFSHNEQIALNTANELQVKLNETIASSLAVSTSLGSLTRNHNELAQATAALLGNLVRNRMLTAELSETIGLALQEEPDGNQLAQLAQTVAQDLESESSDASLDTISRDDLARLPLNAQSLSVYAKRANPSLPINTQLQEKMLDDIRRARLSQVLPNIGAIDQIVGKTDEAVANLRRQNPDLFGSATDFIAKALAFYYPQFRKLHGFSAQTMDAFEELQGLVRRT